MRWGSLAEPLLIAKTTAMLSHMQQTRCPAQSRPQIATAATIGTSSLGVIGVEDHVDGHGIWNQQPFHVAPHPHEPDASDHMNCDRSAAGRSETPFQDCRKVCHHAMSALALAVRWTWWSSALTVAAASIKLRRNVLPG